MLILLEVTSSFPACSDISVEVAFPAISSSEVRDDTWKMTVA